MRIAWLSDVHLNFVEPAILHEFFVQLHDAAADAVVISGDLGEAHTVAQYLQQIAEGTRRPVYFVLGNHDFYHGSIANVRERMIELCAQVPALHYLTHLSFLPLSERTVILGHDGWADGREGDFMRSFVSMHDHRLIAELTGHQKLKRWEVLKQLGDEAAAHIRTHLPSALEQAEHALLITHVPPLRAACWYDGRISDDEWAPHFTCQAMGEALLDVMDQHPDRQLTVLCGHTHGCGETHPRSNITIYTAGAEYGHPVVAKILEVL